MKCTTCGGPLVISSKPAKLKKYCSRKCKNTAYMNRCADKIIQARKLRTRLIKDTEALSRAGVNYE